MRPIGKDPGPALSHEGYETQQVFVDPSGQQARKIKLKYNG